MKAVISVLEQTLDIQTLDSTNPRHTNPRQYLRQTVQTLDSTNPRQVQTLDRYRRQTGTNPRQYKPQTVQTLDKYIFKVKPQTVHILTFNMNFFSYKTIKVLLDDLPRFKLSTNNSQLMSLIIRFCILWNRLNIIYILYLSSYNNTQIYLYTLNRCTHLLWQSEGI